LVGSTPFKPYDMSPLKTPFPMLKPKIESVDEEEKKLIQAEEDEEKAESAGETEAIKNSPNSTEGGVKSAIDEKPSRRQSPIIPSSSPPRATSIGRFIGAESPSITRPGTASSKGLSLLVEAGKEAEKLSGSPDSGALDTAASGSFSHGQPTSHPLAAPPSLRPSPMITNAMGDVSHSAGMQSAYQQPTAPQAIQQHQPQLQHQHSYPGMNSGAQDSDDEGIDLAKGFQPIGSYHQHNHLAMGMHNMGNSHPLGVTPAPRAPSFGR